MSIYLYPNHKRVRNTWIFRFPPELLKSCAGRSIGRPANSPPEDRLREENDLVYKFFSAFHSRNNCSSWSRLRPERSSASPRQASVSRTVSAMGRKVRPSWSAFWQFAAFIPAYSAGIQGCKTNRASCFLSRSSLTQTKRVSLVVADLHSSRKRAVDSA